METLFINIAKSSGLIAIFYIAYFSLLRKETFFNTNRWFLLAGLLTSVILPWIVFTTIVWVEPTSTNIDWTKIPMTPVQEKSFEINWYLVLAITYAVGTVLLLAQFAYDFYHLNNVIKGKAVQRQADHKFIDLNENIAPFSYFNTIVYNSSLYSEAEMESILEHEKIHSEQYHTIDVLITRIFCILFWFNPFIWLYRNAILQNLEFIADNEATKNISDKKGYQLTLLKITTHENCVVLTNHFYQSLIKKRIVMLNKNQSKKRNSWKYALVLPVLVAFVFLFQMEVIAKEKNVRPKAEQAASNDVDVYEITKNTTETELKEKAERISKNYGITVQFSATKRNANNELTAINVELKKGTEISNNRNANSSEAIKPFAIVITKDSNGKISIDFIEEDKSVEKLVVVNNVVSSNTPISADAQIYINNEKSDKATMDKLDPKEIVNMNVTKNDEKKEIRIITKNFSKIGDDNEIYINGKKTSQNEFEQLEEGSIERIDITNNFGKKSMLITTKKGTHYQDKNMPVPPVPPTPPVMKFKAPTAPAFPKAPKAPKGDPINGDKKAWKEFEKKMEDYDAKMKKLEPQMEAFDKQMAEFDKQMEPFNKEMEAFDEKMKVYEKEMQKYLAEKKDKS